MKIISYSNKEQKKVRVALKIGELAIDIESGANQFISGDNFSNQFISHLSMLSLLNNWQHNIEILKKLEEKLQNEPADFLMVDKNLDTYTLSEINIHSPIPVPNSFRDFYAFEKHVKTARKLRNLDVAKEWYDFPVFYFSNKNAFFGHNEIIQKPNYTHEMDFELEVACIIGKKGKNIKPEDASDFIAGYSILNDWSARDIQREEMKVGLGPAKGKDFATSMGPYLMTPDEISDFKKNKGYDLKMIARKNDQIISEGNWSDIHYSFEEMIVRASDEVTLYSGDVLGSGTVGTGCILELRPENTDGWIQPGDEIELEIEKLGKLKNKIL